MKNFIKDLQIHRVYKKGDILYYENTPTYGLYYIEKGTVKIYSTDKNGSEVILRLASKGDIFGYGHLVGEKNHKDSAKALEETHSYFIDAKIIKELMAKNPDLASHLMEMLGKELLHTQYRCMNLIKKNVRERLAYHFHYMGQHHSEVVNGKVKIKLQLSREEIASIIGTASETAIRFISEFKELGLIQEEDRIFHLLDPNKISTIARQNL